MDNKYIGISEIRPDAISKVTGNAIFQDEIRLPGILHTAILWPEYAHTIIVNIDSSETEKCPGVG